MHDRWEASLSEYLDGDLPAAAGRELERHIEACAGCRATLEDLRALKGDLARLPDRAPEPRLWHAIQMRIDAGGRSWAAPWTWSPRLLTSAALAGAALALILGTGLWLRIWLRQPPAAAASAYEAAAAAWRERLARAEIDPALSDLLESNLAPFDAAIAAVRLEVDKHPEDPILRQHLERLMRSELLFLRRAETAGRRAGAIRGDGT
jgi:anti-sigma factor RsiW